MVSFIDLDKCTNAIDDDYDDPYTKKKLLTKHAAKATSIRRALSIDCMEPSLRSTTVGVF